MIAIDTNVLVRFLLQDDPEQGRLAAEFFDELTDEGPGYICREVMVELVWALERAYRLKRTEIARVIEGLLASHDLEIEERDRMALVLIGYMSGGAGFSDRLILAASKKVGCKGLVTFDGSLAREAGVKALA